MSESTPHPEGASQQATGEQTQQASQQQAGQPAPPYGQPASYGQSTQAPYGQPPQYGQLAPYGGQQPYAQNGYQQPYVQSPYGQQAYPQQYTQVAYAAYGPPQPKGLSITSMVLGLVSIVFWFTFLVPAAAIVLGIIGLKKEPAGRGMSLTGIILGGICLLGTIVVIVLWIVFVVIAAGTAGVVGTTSGYAS